MRATFFWLGYGMTAAGIFWIADKTSLAPIMLIALGGFFAGVATGLDVTGEIRK